VVVLFIPVAIYDLEHAPIYNWQGYAQRYVPICSLLGAALFLVQFWWHDSILKRQVNFRYTTRAEERRLFLTLEPLVIATGLPMPRLAVIASTALNAFACGLDQANAVIVVTRGLLNALDDKELAAVLAHELAHIKNGDLRLMAAATVCHQTMLVLYHHTSWGGRTYQKALGLFASMLLLPMLFLAYIVFSALSSASP
jgi:Zn-dependent protease with chaperone function